uniref:Uncharacterized protein n=1 Tax=Setaria viridis TaxID=4556 RepID=A0A4U6VBS1_SETVI|nr:hypothetical protein SEVIR_3G135000v2 [Setaria viridis]
MRVISARSCESHMFEWRPTPTWCGLGGLVGHPSGAAGLRHSHSSRWPFYPRSRGGLARRVAPARDHIRVQFEGRRGVPEAYLMCGMATLPFRATVSCPEGATPA